ncbi:hypothetical protein ACFQX4_19365 [Roseomonas sp. GCM10028921]
MQHTHIAGHSDSSAWVLDGATGLTSRRLLPGPSDAAWLAEAYHRGLEARAGATRVGLRALFTELIDSVGSRLHRPDIAAERYELPSAGIVFVRLQPQGRLEYARLGDCRAILRCGQGAGARTVSTRRSPLHRPDARVIRQIASLIRSGRARDYAEARKTSTVEEAPRANRALQNTKGGYWVLGLDPAAARHMETGSVALPDGQGGIGLLVSDGFYRLVDTFHFFGSDAALLDAALSGGLGPLLGRLRDVEEADRGCRDYPRLKPRDDATALLFTFSGPAR